MKIAVCASEGAPYCKSGGLGDVMEALPAALSRIEGNEVVLFLPYYYKVKHNAARKSSTAQMVNIFFFNSSYLPCDFACILYIIML